MKTFFFLILCVSILGSCASSKNASRINNPVLSDINTFKLTEQSTDNTYGYTAKNPIKVGGVDKSEGPKNEQRFLNALAGPNEEPITYKRLGSCCPFNSKNGFMGGGMLDKYEIKWEGQNEPVVIFINMYDYGELKIPVGFTLKNDTKLSVP